MWYEGMECPVPRCPAKSLRDTNVMERHWKERHEPVVKVLYCSVCETSFRRKSNLKHHFRKKHSHLADNAVGREDFVPNSKFIDPGDISLFHILNFAKKTQAENLLKTIKS